MAKIDFNVLSVTDGRSPAGIKLDLQEIVEAILAVVTRLDTAAVAAHLAHEVGWLGLFDSHLILHAEFSASVLL